MDKSSIAAELNLMVMEMGETGVPVVRMIAGVKVECYIAKPNRTCWKFQDMQLAREALVTFIHANQVTA